MKWRLSEKLTELLVDTAVAVLFVISFGQSFFHVRGYDIGFGQTLYSALIVMLLVLLLSRRWWLTPLLGFGVFVSAAWLIWRTEAWEEIVEIAGEFNQWASIYIRFGEPESAWLTLLVPLILLPVSISLFTLVRLISHLAVYLFLTAAVYLPLLIWYPDTFSAFLIALAALLILMPRHFSQAVHLQRPQDTRLPRSSMQVLAIPVAIISLLSAQLLIPDNTSNWRWMPLVNRIQDIDDIWQNTLGGGRYWQGFDLGDYGYAVTGQRMGGPTQLSDRPVMRVTTRTPVLMRGITRSEYTGFSWNRPARQHFRFNSMLWAQIRRQTFNAHYPISRSEQAFRDRFMQEVSMEVDHQIRMSTLFTGGRVTEIETSDLLNHPPYFTEDGDLFVYSPLPVRDSYTQTFVYFDRGSDGFDEAIVELEKRLSGTTDRNEQRVINEYMQLPDTLPDIVFETAADLTAEGETPYEKAVLLETYMRDQFTYSLEPVMPPENEDFVAHFLETETGYCVYFASAMVVMARTLDIPARYVEGFVLEEASQEHRYSATGENAHAWAELYFPGIGWLTFDATPAAQIPDDENDLDLPIVDLTPEPSPSISPPSDFDLIDPEEEDQTAGLLFLAVLVAIISIIVLARFMIWLARRRHRQRFVPENVHLRVPDRRRRMDYYYQDMLRQLDCIDLQPENGETLQQFAQRAEAYLKILSHPVPEVFWAVARMRYGNREPDEDMIMKAALLHQKIEARIRDTMPALTYFIRRVLLAVRPD